MDRIACTRENLEPALARLFPAAQVTLVSDWGVVLAGLLVPAPRRARKAAPGLRELADQWRGAALDLEALLEGPPLVALVLSRDPEEVLALDAAHRLGEAAKQALLDRGDWYAHQEHRGGWGAVQPLLALPRSQGRVLEP